MSEAGLDKIITVQSVLYCHTNYIDSYLVYKSIAIMATPAITLQDGIYSSSRTQPVIADCWSTKEPQESQQYVAEDIYLSALSYLTARLEVQQNHRLVPDEYF